MNYFYDLLINLNDKYAFRFYEWEKNDDIIHLKRIPIFKVKTSDLKKIISSQIIIEKDFLDLIYNKTEVFNEKQNYIEYMALFTDDQTSIVVEFDCNGLSLFKSNLLLEEELNLLEMSYSFKLEKINFKVIKKNINNNLRQVNRVVKFLETEINTLHENKNFLKLKYLYKEFTGIDEENMTVLVNDLLNQIKSDFNENHLKLYNLIKLSYKKLSA